MTELSSHRMMGSGTGTLFSGVVEGFILCLWRAANILYSRSTWWAVWERSCPAGFLRRTKRVFLLKKKHQGKLNDCQVLHTLHP